MYLAHTSQNGAKQSIVEHSMNTAKKCEMFAVDPWKEILQEIALLHDIGKYQPSFQKRINGDDRIRVPHAICGAKEWELRYGKKAYSRLAQYVISGHHTGLHNGGNKCDGPEDATLLGSLKKDCEDYSAYKDEIPLTFFDYSGINTYMENSCRTKEQLAERFAFFVRYCFSCLTDADWLDTEEFCTGQHRKSLVADFGACLDAINKELDGFICKTELQKTRSLIQRQVYENTAIDGKVFLINMPTGSGKTLASIKFALKRSVSKGYRRIIYIIPYNSIIDQTAESFKRIFGSRADILRHQSSFNFEPSEDQSEKDILYLKQATENWDAQIILTTAVQFFESVYSNKRSKLRKMHNMAKSILIFDEAHLMPQEFLQPCLQAITHITKFLNSEAIFLTATMPNYSKLMKEFCEKDIDVVDLVNNKSQYSIFEKCKYKWVGSVSDQALVMLNKNAPSMLIVVNSRAVAVSIYNTAKLAGIGQCFHLSTYMTARDRTNIIDEIKLQLEGLWRDYPDMQDVPEERKVFVVSTSLIEAGVDLDFSVVCRELWGLDSILQAGGRCNREGKIKHGDVLIFQRLEEQSKKMNLAASITKTLINEFPNISSAECISTYYERLFFTRKDDLVRNSLGARCSSPINIPFSDYARDFEIIDSKTISVAVEQDDISRRLINRLHNTGTTDVRSLQKYTCTVYAYELDMLINQGVIRTTNGIHCLANKNYYNENTGIKFEGQDIIVERRNK